MVNVNRAAIEYEKKTHASNLEQSQVMEKHMIAMAREIEKLKAELDNAEKRARASALHALLQQLQVINPNTFVCCFYLCMFLAEPVL